MNKKFSISTSVLFFTLFLSGCTYNKNISDKEYYYRESILLKANNHHGLINLYRDRLKLKEDDSTRLKLANSYYLTGDIKSSLYYLHPISHMQNASVHMLQAKNFISNNDNVAARMAVNRLLAISPNNAEAHNLNGIIFANEGNIKKAEIAIEQSRALFISDEIAMNNLAVVAILDERYADAVRILLPDYLAGGREKLMLHNLVFSLVKLDDKQYAKKIISAEKMAKDPDELILALSQVSGPYQDKFAAKAQ
ncbi:tetratricopeptide repeat protein [Yersinia hibernica]|uniref:Tight adherance operon protein n=1 Tax=Yersinia enterocolitica LC20 TaxID=1443113 RepID=A0A7U4GCW1_YEREN|nr:tight adherance operon protein [Yersinia hibernica]AHM72023.1 tight adherance operon protein [Yersinia hibernica]OVZ94330.1 tight adherance operon protein [Yersinia kristensenii]